MVQSHIILEKTLLDTVTDAVIVVCPKRNILTVNRVTETLFGVSEPDVVGKNLGVLFGNTRDSDDLFQIETQLDPDLDLTYIPLQPAQAAPFFGHVKMTPVIDENDFFQGILFVVRDVTKLLEHVSRLQKDAESDRNLKRSARQMLEKLPVCFLQINSKGLIECVSDFYCAFVGLDRSQLENQPIMSFMNDEDRRLVRRHIMSMSDDQPVRIYEQKYPQPDGSVRWFIWSILDILKNGTFEATLCIGNDVTEIHDNQTSIAAQSAELQRKNDALGQFAAIVSHDLKAPLRHIAMFADMMNEDVSSQKYDDLSLYAHHVRNSAVRMDRIIKSLLQYSQISYRIVSKNHFDPSGTVINAIQNLETVIEEAKADILVGKMPYLNGDAELIRHLIQNLLSNAVKYRKPGIKPKIRIYATENDTEVRLIVEDNGIGIDPKHANRIFGPFQRLHKDEKIYEGFGIGLALCKQIAESHDGSIELDTDYLNGARFVVHLPKLAEATDA